MSEMHLAALYRYPVKSLAGQALEHSLVDGFGLADDRRWMLVDREGRYVTQRELPEMALISASLDQRRLTLNAPGMTPLAVDPPADNAEPINVQIWRDRCQARLCSNESQIWLSRYLGHTLRLVYMAEGERRQVDRAYAEEGDLTAFSDGFPLLLISQASLDDLNGRLEQALPMIRFRPNLVVAGCEPYAEDGWSLIRIGEMTLRVVKPCSRCKITTIDPYTAEVGDEPLKTLASYRRQGNQVFFGQNLIHDGPGELKLGMPVEVLRYAE